MKPTTVDTEFLRALNSILAQWTSPDFITAVAACEGVMLDPGAITMVRILRAMGPQRPSALAARMVTGASNISKIAARLQDAGIIHKLADPQDSRASLLALTDAGQDTADALGRSGDSLVEELIGHWPAADKSALLRLVSKFEAETRRVAAELRN
ncbi:hypothetical protein CQ018_15260 [Arthrobacter sp. MYb227]|uniref:MarR family winged helix-turn-helix transcriptional regulator n=1 Tax=Arthrobacter sp. MYb227 TaxID=1848601 RepID=UPI000CFE138E|nr:MarR family winged helix-turn-helix transcriptional regulator [Arthrobacter sp. MYb227]PQZ89521.1 hypothetical protein CQ018_15260 [Arthrobacter sp. MYb227]